jgi:hypothetical protein
MKTPSPESELWVPPHYGGLDSLQNASAEMQKRQLGGGCSQGNVGNGSSILLQTVRLAACGSGKPWGFLLTR